MKRRSIARLIFGFGLAVLVVTPSARAGPPAAHRLGGELPLPDLFDVVQGLQPQARRRHRRLPGQGQRRGHPGLHQPHRRFRGQRRGHDRRGDRQGAGRRAAAADDRRRDRPRLQPAGQPEGSEAAARRLPGIFLGKITKWNDPKLKAANPGVNLPDTDITVVRRADSSGTTFVFTKHLSAISEEWKKGPRRRHHGQLAQQRQDRGRAQERRRDRHHQADPGGDRLHRVRYAKLAKVEMALLQNKAGQYVAPGGEGGRRGARQREAARRPAAWLHRSGGGQGLPDHHLHLDAVLQEEQRPQEGGGAARDGRVLPDRRPEDERADGLHPAACERGGRGPARPSSNIQ